jgi:YidC/Oxa1 family membrane protein insertase
MDKQTTIAFILIGAILVLYFYLNSPTPVEQNKITSDTTLVQRDTSLQNEKPEASNSSVNNVENNNKVSSSDFGKYFTQPQSKEQIITIENDLLVLELSNKGGDIKRCFLKKFKNWYSAGDDTSKDFYKTHVQLIRYPEGGGGPDLAFVSADGKAINTAHLIFTSNASKYDYKLTGKDSLTINYTFLISKDKYLEKKYTFYGNKYSINYSVRLAGLDSIISNNGFDLVWNKGIRLVEENSVDEAEYSNASAFYGGDHVVVEASKPNETVQKSFAGKVDWVAVRDKYFAFIIAPKNPSGVDGAYIEGVKRNGKNEGVRLNYNLRINLPFNNDNIEQKSFLLYLGPVDYSILKTYGHNLDAIVEYGSFFGIKFLVRPIAEYLLVPVFNFLHSFIPNYGIVIIIFSLIIKIILHPLTRSSYQSMKKMQLIQPMMTEIKEKYKDDPQRMNKEMMKLYSTYGINPAGGCLPLVLQMPIFIALFGFFKVAIELRQQPFIFWMTDLSRPDVIYNLPFKLPLFGINEISGLALLMGVATFFQQKMSISDPKQKSLVYIMPVFLTLLFMSFPAGLNLYYLMFNVFSIGQQYYINHKQSGMELKPVKNPKKSKGFFTKLMEAAEQNAKAQQKRKK